MEHYYARNDSAHRDFLAILAHDKAAPQEGDPAALREIVDKFCVEAKTLHNKQWSEHIYNIIDSQTQCPNDCRYCYMKTIKARFFGVPLLTDIEAAHEPIECRADAKRVEKGWAKARQGARKMIMFPSSHDIVPSLLADYIAVALKILVAGHDLLIVSKPRMDCMTRVAEALEPFKKRVIYRLTIGSDQQDVLSFWEPTAPTFAERLAVLRMLFERGCLTSISMEPFLTDPRSLIRAVAPFVSETIWIGTMSGLTEALAGSSREFARLKALHSVEAMRALACEVHSPGSSLASEKVRWKAKIMARIAQSIAA